MIKIAINGFGRIGRNILRAIYEGPYGKDIKLVAINDLNSTDANAHLLKYDTAHGHFNAELSHDEESITVNGDRISAFMQREPDKLPWGELDVDIVFECTGFFRSRDLAALHLTAGAKKVLVSAPGKKLDGVGLDATVVFGVNEDILTANDRLVSNASCTTNCLAHVAKAMHDSVGIEHGLVNTVHAYTNTQNLLDSFHKDKRRGRAAAYSMIPTSTGSAQAIGDVIPALAGKLDALAIRTPVLNVSLLDFTFTSSKSVSAADIRDILESYAAQRPGVFELGYEPLVSIDYNHNPASCVVDMEQRYSKGNLTKLLAWYDNEWGYSNRMLDTALVMAAT